MTIPLLARRIGPDTVSKLEAASGRRLLEAEVLIEAGQGLGAIYLLGYSVEARLAAAYFRLIGFRSVTEITEPIRRRVPAAAVQQKLMSPRPHDVAGWGQLLVATRKRRMFGYGNEFRADIIRHSRAAYARWRPNLRYRITVPTPDEVSVVLDAARWFREHYQDLWR